MRGTHIREELDWLEEHAYKDPENGTWRCKSTGAEIRNIVVHRQKDDIDGVYRPNPEIVGESQVSFNKLVCPACPNETPPVPEHVMLDDLEAVSSEELEDA